MIKIYKHSVIILLSLIINLFFLHQGLTTTSVTISDYEKDRTIKIAEIWKDQIDKKKEKNHSKLCPVINNSHIFIANKKGRVKALSLDSGKIIWSVNLSPIFLNQSILLSGGISLSDNQIYIGSEKAIMYALHAKNGALLWKSSVAGEVLSIPVITQDSLLLQTENGMLQVLNKLDGTINWTIHIDTPFIKIRGTPSPILICNRAIVGTSNGIVSSILLNNGKILWQRNLSLYNKKEKNFRDITGIKSINHIVYAIAYNGILAAINLFSGEIIWYERIEGGEFRDFLVTENAIYLLDQNNRLIAWNIRERKIIWEQKQFIQENKLTDIILDANNIFIFDDKGYLYCINVMNGILLGKVKLIRSGLICSPIIYGNKLIIQSQYGMLHTFLIKRSR
ncbi:PQQ-binding-like beta-propeller repeat protein [Candidatus Schneideria nysicola]|uniref:outer membrane protein assembly factor BamB family protein n=1 Tax=Candidatus Schneideria nysicola TaxID=1081631 RepID=UPI001CAA770F|nr:PQQ-binding-like beta-propeller repeat protein [Candidatus Schneideria nysicola]UAJ65350.1 PQQ-binding-like beta-propeller repeat protein [Candidatus Schneideria nysicola]